MHVKMTPKVAAGLIALATGVATSSCARRAASDDRAAIETFNRELEAATRRMDDSASLALWDDDGVSLMPSVAPIVGKRAIATFVTSITSQLKGSRMESFAMRCFDIQHSGPLASEWCVEHQVVLLPDGRKFDGWGKMAFVLHRGDDGRWRLKQETWSRGLPSDSVLLSDRAQIGSP